MVSNSGAIVGGVFGLMGSLGTPVATQLACVAIIGIADLSVVLVLVLKWGTMDRHSGGPSPCAASAASTTVMMVQLRTVDAVHNQQLLRCGSKLSLSSGDRSVSVLFSLPVRYRYTDASEVDFYFNCQ